MFPILLEVFVLLPIIVMGVSVAPITTKAANNPPHFVLNKQEFSACMPNFSGRIGATDPDGDQVTYTIISSSIAALDYTIDTGTGLVKSLRPFNANEKSVLTIQAADKENHSSTSTVTISYKDCGSRIVEPEPSEARILEPSNVDSSPDARISSPSQTKYSYANAPQSILGPISVHIGYSPKVPNSPYRNPYPQQPMSVGNLPVVVYAGYNGQFPPKAPVAQVHGVGGNGALYFYSLDSRFFVVPTSYRTGVIVTAIPLPRGDYPFIVRVEDRTGRSDNIYVKIAIR